MVLSARMDAELLEYLHSATEVQKDPDTQAKTACVLSN